MESKIKIKNKKASYEYVLIDRYTAGIQLQGTEIKSIRAGKVSLGEAYCSFKGDELFVINMHIAEYEYGTYNNHEPKRDRKLLLTARELKKISNKVKEKGFTVVPTFLFINDNNGFWYILYASKVLDACRRSRTLCGGTEEAPAEANKGSRLVRRHSGG